MLEITETEPSLIGGAVGIGAICAMVSVLILSNVIDNWIRERFSLGRGQTMLLLLGISLMVGLISGLIGYQILAARETGDPPAGEPVAARIRP